MKAHSTVWTRAAPDHSPSTLDLSVHGDRQLKEGDKVAKRGNRCETEMLTPQCLSPPPFQRTEWGPHPDVASGSALLSSHAHTVTRGTVPNGPHSPQNPMIKKSRTQRVPRCCACACAVLVSGKVLWLHFGDVAAFCGGHHANRIRGGYAATPLTAKNHSVLIIKNPVSFHKFRYYPWKFGLITERPEEIHV